MSVRRRTWAAPAGETKEAWVCNYTDANGARRLRTFGRKSEAKAFEAAATNEIKHGVHTPESQSVTVGEAAESWLDDCAARGLERSTLAQYEQHVRLHINPHLGREKLPRLSTPAVCDFRDRLRRSDASQAMVRKVVTSLGSLIAHAKERGKFAGANPVRDIAKGKRGHGGRAESRQKRRLQIPGMKSGVSLRLRHSEKCLF